MTSSLMWKPQTDARGVLPDELKRAISRRLWDTDGSMGGGVVAVDQGDVEYLKGLDDSGIKGAKQLIKLIENHGTVLLWHEH